MPFPTTFSPDLTYKFTYLRVNHNGSDFEAFNLMVINKLPINALSHLECQFTDKKRALVGAIMVSAWENRYIHKK